VVSPSVHQFAALSSKSVRRERTQDGICTHICQLLPKLSSPAVIAPCPSRFESRGNRRNALEERCSPQAIDTLKEAMVDQKAPWSAKITAAIAVLDRGWGKPTQAVDANLSFFDGLTDHDRQALLAALEAIQAGVFNT
jgi:hypothetical protein